MDDCKYLVVSSVTMAFKAKNVLEDAGASCKVEKLRDMTVAEGCGYAVRIEARYVNQAVKALRKNSIRVIAVLDCVGG